MNESYRARMTCFHEAGHVVVAHAFGWQLAGVKLGLRGGGLEVNSAESFGTPGGSQWCAALRRGMAVLAAGPVAGTLHQCEVEERGFCCREESRMYSKYWDFRTSVRYPHNPDDDPTSDYAKIVHVAERIFYFNLQVPLVKGGDVALIQSMLDEHIAKADPAKRIRAEILRAERRAEAILKKSWDVVTRVATRLHKSKKWELSARQLLAILEPAQ